MGQRGDGFAGGGETFALHIFLEEASVFDGHAGDVADGGEEAELVLGVGEIRDEGVNVDDAKDAVTAGDGHADGGADGEVVDAFTAAEALVSRGVTGEDAFLAGDDVLDDGLGDGNFADLVFV